MATWAAIRLRQRSTASPLDRFESSHQVGVRVAHNHGASKVGNAIYRTRRVGTICRNIAQTHDHVDTALVHVAKDRIKSQRVTVNIRNQPNPHTS